MRFVWRIGLSIYLHASTSVEMLWVRERFDWGSRREWLVLFPGNLYFLAVASSPASCCYETLMDFDQCS